MPVLTSRTVIFPLSFCCGQVLFRLHHSQQLIPCGTAGSAPGPGFQVPLVPSGQGDPFPSLQLLILHFCFMLHINTLSRTILINPGGVTDKVSPGDISGD